MRAEAWVNGLRSGIFSRSRDGAAVPPYITNQKNQQEEPDEVE
jgi:hypothetical protein